MKKMNVLILGFVCYAFLLNPVNANGLATNFNDYEIQAIETGNLENDVEMAWNLTYNSGNNPLTVKKRNTNKGVFYVVNSQHFEVCYASTQKGFGTANLKNSWSKVPMEINDVILNPEEIKNQKIISPERVNDELALGLIAGYLPYLLNEEYQHLLN